jgi:hypothetical protein
VPSVAEAELEHNFERVMDVLATRNYARAKAAYDGLADLSPEGKARVLADPTVQLVRETEFKLVAEALAEKERKQGG